MMHVTQNDVFYILIIGVKKNRSLKEPVIAQWVI